MKILTVSIGILSTLIGFSQSLDSTFMKGMTIRHVGPAGMSGRVTTIDIHPNNDQKIIIGTASGGVWTSDNGGVKWDPIFDDEATQSIGAVAYSNINPDLIWVGTGEGNPRNSQSSGKGVYKSIDGGKTWKLCGLENTKTIHRIIPHPYKPEVTTLAAMGSAWGPNKERGVYQTRDGGKTWKQILYVDDTTGCADLIVDPSNPDKMIAAMWSYHREPWFFTSGGNGSGLYITYDGGENWKKLGKKNGLPEGTIGRSGLTICHDKPNVVYALVESKKTALYRSNNGGENWYKVSDKNIGNRPFYYADIFCDPKNENRLYNLYSVLSKSEDGGKSFSTILPYHIGHPDHHAFWISPSNPDYIIEGNDGGINISKDGGDTWRFVENLPVAQFYHINYDNDVPYNLYGGMQDNGSWIGPSKVWHTGGIQNADWQEVLFGDGFDVMPKAGHSRYGYAMYQGGNLYTYDRETGATQRIQPVAKDSVPLRFNWNAALAQDPHNPCGVYFGSQYVHYSNDCGESWTVLSEDLTSNDPEKQKQAKSGGLTIDATKAENYTTITCIAPSPLDENVIWVGTDDGNLWLTQDKGKSWTNLNKHIDKYAKKGAWIPQITPSNFNKEEAFVVANDYRRNNWQPFAIKVSAYGKKASSIINSDIEGHCHSIVQDNIEKNLLFLGTEYGLYASVDGGASWQKWSVNYPSVPTVDLKIHPRESDLIIGTFGRAAYVLDDIKPLRALANKSLSTKEFTVFDSNDAYDVSYIQNPGMRFGADAHYRGQNGTSAAKFAYYLDKLSKPSKEEKKDSSAKELDYKHIKIALINLRNDTVRQFKQKADTGMHHIYWNLRKDGVHYPSRRERKKDADAPSGRNVEPGTYKMVAVYADKKDSAMVKVYTDPRISENFAALKQRYDLYDKHEKNIARAAEAFQRLNEISDNIKHLLKQEDLLEKDDYKALKDSSKSLQKTVAELQDIFMLSESFEGYEHVTVRLNELIGQTSDYILSSQQAPGPNAKLAYKQCEEEINKAVNKINQFINEDWAAYTTFVQSIKFKTFKEIKPVPND